ncbi:uncharacterized protein BXIN_2989 [Babesia sp. Xinjiang]|uniref:uncharacterized protein n=1 Tax=Babesia sp. Xinjiang TaxID=462227 RepID=UPI000A2328F1|nr:uncharacterized protein BXIN_2989 [Babesia sp. Xinjiang]ORM39344.1 hypothetical protein BXIN_2989 [Babesia sp. Xinjiang]
MDGIWELDVKNALYLIRETNDCVNQFSRNIDGNDKQTYGTIVRAKLDALRKTITNLELTLRDMASSAGAESTLISRRHQFDDIKRSYQQLEGALNHPGGNVPLSTTQPAFQPRELDQMSKSSLYDYRQSVMRAQEDELEMLDSTAGAIHNISTHIRDEVDYHSGLMTDLETAMDSSHAQILSNRATFEQLIRRSSKRRLMFYIVVLTVILVLILIL